MENMKTEAEMVQKGGRFVQRTARECARPHRTSPNTDSTRPTAAIVHMAVAHMSYTCDFACAVR